MQTKLTRKPGQKGTKLLTAQYGDRLVCVRYRYDLEKKKRYKTVELIVEENDWIPNKEIVPLKVAWGEKGIALSIKNAGGVWNADKKVWELPYEKVTELHLEDRILKEWE